MGTEETKEIYGSSSIHNRDVEPEDYITQFIWWVKKERGHCETRLTRLLSQDKISKTFLHNQMKHWDFVLSLAEKEMGGTFEQSVES